MRSLAAIEATSSLHKLDAPSDVNSGVTYSWVGGLLMDQQDATGLLYRRNRYYDPMSGRFSQEDPAGLAGGLNTYGFAQGDRVNYSDPFGLGCKDRNGKDLPEDKCKPAIPAMEDKSWETFNAATFFIGGFRALAGKGIRALISALAGREAKELATKAFIPEGEALLIAVKDGKIVGQTADIMMSHARLAEKAFGAQVLPEGAWIGTVGKLGGRISALNSMTFFGQQGAAPGAIQDLVRSLFR